MSLTTESMTPADIKAVLGNNDGFGNFGGDGWWILLLLLFANGGWGNGFGGNGGTGGLYPWLNNSNQINDGFRDQMLNGSINNIQTGVNALATQLCDGFGGVQMALANGFAGVEQGANARQIANMQTAFANQTAMSNGFYNVSSQLANCCCENRLGIANLGSDIAREACANRTVVSDGIRDLMALTQSQTQTILDKMCQDKIDAKNEKIVELQNQLNMANLRESQVAQNAFIQQGLTNEVDALYNRLSNCPVPTVPVYGRQPIFNCNNNGCGCGCGSM